MLGRYKKEPSKSHNPRLAGPRKPHCTDVKAEAQRLSDLLKVMELWSGRASICKVESSGSILPGRKAPGPKMVAWLLKIMWKLLLLWSCAWGSGRPVDRQAAGWGGGGDTQGLSVPSNHTGHCDSGEASL